MFKLLFFICGPFLLQINGEFEEHFGSATRSVEIGVPPSASPNCHITRAWELSTSFIPDQERARAAYRIMEKALTHLPIKLNNLVVLGALEQLKEPQVEQFEKTWAAVRIQMLYDRMKWAKNEIPFWVHTSGDVAAVITGQLLYSHYSHKNRDINGYYVAENSYAQAQSDEQKKFEETQHFKEVFNTVNDRLRFYLNRVKNFTKEEVVAAFDLCRHLYVSLHTKRDNVLWCKAFFETDLDVFEYHEELNMLNGVFHNSSDLAPNVCGIVDSMESTLNDKKGLLGVTFFTATQQFLPVLKALGLLKEAKADDFEKRFINPFRIKDAAGRLSTLTIYKYGNGCSKKSEIFLNFRRLSDKKHEDLVNTLKNHYKCSQIDY